MHAAALGAAPTTWARHSHTFPRKLPLGLVVKGVAARSELGEVTHHWLVVTGFERGQVQSAADAFRTRHGIRGIASVATHRILLLFIIVLLTQSLHLGMTCIFLAWQKQDGSMGLAEESGSVRPCDVIAGVNRTSFLDKTFNECLRSIAMAEWPLTVHLLRDAEKEPSLIEGWAVAVKEDGRPLMSARDEVRLKWQNQKPGPDTYRCYLELRPRSGDLLLSRPLPGGGVDHTPERSWSLRDVGVVRRVCEKPSSGVGARWCVDLTLHAGSLSKTVLRVQVSKALLRWCGLKKGRLRVLGRVSTEVR